MGKVYFLLVDDEDIVLRVHRRVVEKFFKKAGHIVEILTAGSGDEAIVQVLQHKAHFPDAEWGLITDYDMPGMSGAELVDQLDKLLAEKLLLRLVITGDLDDERKKEIEAKQAFIERKPFPKEALDAYLNVFTMNLSR